MKNYLSLLSITLLLSATVQAQEPVGNVKYVDPTIGGVGLILEPTRPTVHLPNSVIRMYPVRKDQIDDQVSYFPLTMYSHRIGNVFSFMPVSGEITADSWKQKFTYDLEKTTPYYYTVKLQDNDVQLEFTPSKHSGYFRVSYPNTASKWIRMNIVNEEGSLNIEGKRTITGQESFNGMQAFVYGELNTDITFSQYRSENERKQLFIRLATNSPVEFRYAISYISIEQAKQNLLKEIPAWNFSKVKNDALTSWNQVLDQITVAGATEKQKRIFYTALYRTYERMVDINEYGKYYSAYDHQVHSDSKPFYVDNWIWDMYLADEPLHTI